MNDSQFDVIIGFLSELYPALSARLELDTVRAFWRNALDGFDAEDVDEAIRNWMHTTNQQPTLSNLVTSARQVRHLKTEREQGVRLKTEIPEKEQRMGRHVLRICAFIAETGNLEQARQMYLDLADAEPDLADDCVHMARVVYGIEQEKPHRQNGRR